MSSNDPKKLVLELAKQIGKGEARRLLVEEGVSTSTAEKLVGERYESEVRGLVRAAILRAMQAAKLTA
jgi:hypothetical protein